MTAPDDRVLEDFLAAPVPRDVPARLRRGVLGEGWALARNGAVVAAVAALAVALAGAPPWLPAACAATALALLATAAGLAGRALAPLRDGAVEVGVPHELDARRATLKIAAASPAGEQQVFARVHREALGRAQELVEAAGAVQLLGAPGRSRRRVVAELLLVPRSRRRAAGIASIACGVGLVVAYFAVLHGSGEVAAEPVLLDAEHGRPREAFEQTVVLDPSMAPVVLELRAYRAHGDPLASLPVRIEDPHGNPVPVGGGSGGWVDTLFRTLATIRDVVPGPYRVRGVLPPRGGVERLALRVRVRTTQPSFALFGAGFLACGFGALLVCVDALRRAAALHAQRRRPQPDRIRSN